MSITEIKKHNSKEFIDDLKKVSQIMVWVVHTNTYLSVTKRELKTQAETNKIYYYITDQIFRARRDVMVVF